MTKCKMIRIESPWGYWRMEEIGGAVLTIPNGLVGRERDDGLVEFFNGRVLLRVPQHWRAPLVDGEQEK